MPASAVDGETMIHALDDREPSHTYYLDCQTGEVLWVPDYGDGPVPMHEKARRQKNRYLEVEPLPTEKAVEVRRQFLAKVPEGHQKQALSSALDANDPVEAFEWAITEFGPIMNAWLDYHEEQYLELARQWLIARGLNAPPVLDFQGEA